MGSRTKGPWRPNLFAYSDYREYLRDYYTAAKAHWPGFSYRYFSRRAGFSSPNFLKLVADGKRNLGPSSIPRFARALGLDREERTFFGHLVAFAQADDPDEKSAAFERVAASRRFRQARRIDGALFEYLSSWYNPVIREMVGCRDFREDPAWIAARLVPPIAPEAAKQALELLLRLGLLERSDDGSLTRGEPSLTTGHEVRSLAVRNYHRQMLERAGEAIDLVEPDRRDVSALTVCVSPETAALLKERIHEFRERLLDVSDRDPDPTLVYQINIQLFPFSQTQEDE